MNQKVTVNLSSPANTVCANKDGTKVAVAGRKSINIDITIIIIFYYSSREMTVILLSFLIAFIICDTTDQLKEVINLRNLPQKQLNLNFSSNHVQWNPRDGM